MDEEEFDALMGARPFRTADAMQAEARWRRCATLGTALWGKTSADLQRQLLTPYPAIPSGFDLADLRELHRSAQEIAFAMSNPRQTWLSRMAAFSPAIFVGTQRFTIWEARCEIVRRAIEYVEKR